MLFATKHCILVISGNAAPRLPQLLVLCYSCWDLDEMLSSRPRRKHEAFVKTSCFRRDLDESMKLSLRPPQKHEAFCWDLDKSMKPFVEISTKARSLSSRPQRKHSYRHINCDKMWIRDKIAYVGGPTSFLKTFLPSPGQGVIIDESSTSATLPQTQKIDTIDYQPIYFFGFNPKKVNIYKAKTTRKQAKMTILCISWRKMVQIWSIWF